MESMLATGTIKNSDTGLGLMQVTAAHYFISLALFASENFYFTHISHIVALICE